MIRKYCIFFILLLYNSIYAHTNQVNNTNIAQDKIPVTVSFSILSDIVHQIGGDKIMIHTLVGQNQDVHDYELKPQDIININNSKLFFINGLGLEAGFVYKIQNTTKATLVDTTKKISPLKLLDNNTIKIDPHAWGNTNNIIKYYIPNILTALIEESPQNKAYFVNNANQYTNKLKKLDKSIKIKLQVISPTRRKLITTHDAFGYFAKAYNIDFLYAQGISTDSEATTQDIAKLEKLIKNSDIKIVFLENMTNNKLITQIAKDTNAIIGGKLYSDALSENNEPADSYLNMINYNINTLINAWKK